MKFTDAPSSGGALAAEPNRWAGIAAATATMTAVGIGMGLALPLLSLMLEARQISGTMIGINTAAAGIASIAATPFATPLARRLGMPQLLAVSVVLIAISFWGFFVTANIWLWFGLRLVFHGALTIAFILAEFWINALAPADQRGFVMGIYATVLSLGFATGPLILSATGSTGPAPFVTGSLIMAAAVLPVMLAWRERPPMSERPSASILHFLRIAPLATLAAFIFGMVESGGFALLPVYGRHLGLSPELAAVLVSAVALGNVLMQIPIGMVADRVDRRTVLLVIAVVGASGAAAAPIAAAAGLPVLLTLLFVWGGAVAGFYTVGLTHLGARFRGTDLASANAAFILMYSIGVLVGPAAFGAGLDAWDPHGLPAVAALAFAAYALLALVRRLTGEMER